MGFHKIKNCTAKKTANRVGENECQLSIDRGLMSTPLWDDPHLRLRTLPGSCQQHPTEGLPSVNNKSSDSKSVIYVYSVQDHLDYWRTHLCLTMTLWCCYLFVCGKGVYMSVCGYVCMCPCMCLWCTCRGYITLHTRFSETGSQACSSPFALKGWAASYWDHAVFLPALDHRHGLL